MSDQNFTYPPSHPSTSSHSSQSHPLDTSNISESDISQTDHIPHFISDPNYQFIIPPTNFIPSMNQTYLNPPNSVLTMPNPGTKLAPEKFRGDFHKVKDFIQHYERLCAQNNVGSNTDKCEVLLRYCSKKERETIKNIGSYISKDWAQLKKDILRLYDADLDTKRYTIKDVREFSKREKKKHVENLAKWRKYCRAFLRIAGSLLVTGKISANEHATCFWQGIPKSLRGKIERRILARNPIRDLSEPFNVDDVDKAAEAILQRDRFDIVSAVTDSEGGESSGDESSSGSDDESSDSESEDDHRKKDRYSQRRRKSHKRRRSLEDKKEKSDFPKNRLVTGTRKEVAGLIKQMSYLALDDPEYGVAYYNATSLDPNVKNIVAKPVLRQAPLQYSSRSTASSYQQNISPQPPTIVPRPPSYPRNPQPMPPRGSEISCYGCGEKGHGMFACGKIQ